MERVKPSLTKSEERFREARKIVPGGVNSVLRNAPPPLVFQEARGARLVDVDGNEYLDYQGAYGAAILGHNHPAVARKVAAALEAPLLPGFGTTELEIALARKIHCHVPSADKVLLLNTGSEATYHALRVARAATGRMKIVKFQGCYHGFHDSVLRNIASPPEKLGGLDAGSAGMLPQALENTLVCEFNNLDDVERTFNAHRGEIAALITEPIPHNVGCILPKPGFLQSLREVTAAHGTVLIFDEIITGFRHHLGGYQAIAGLKPDLTTLGKAIANGFPMAALCGKSDLMDHFSTRPGGDTFFAGTFNGNAVGCAAALATIELLETEPVHEHIFRLGEMMRQGLGEIHRRLGLSATVAGFGSIFLTCFMEGPIESYADLLRNDAARFLAYRRRLIERGVLKVPLNLKRCHLSYSHTQSDVERTLEIAEDVLKAL